MHAADRGDVDDARTRGARDVAADERRAFDGGSIQEPVTMPSSTSTPSDAGSASESSSARGVAPIAARSLTLAARARCPMARGGTNA
jgi:hypothetical protein